MLKNLSFTFFMSHVWEFAGVYSDTHLLALMYAAEMCYWHQQAVNKGRFTSDSDPSVCSFNIRQKGLQYLEDYLTVVRGPLQGHGWDTSRAEQIKKYLSEGR
jgi:hypothetical protein